MADNQNMEHGGKAAPLRSAPSPEPVPQQTINGLRLVYLQALRALLRYDPDAQQWLDSLYREAA